MSDPNLITTYTFQGRPFLVKMNVINGCLELILTDKMSGEEWECSYDATYIESLTRKTGNFKQFEIFVTMLKAGLLKTTDCVTMDLLSHEDLEALRIQRVKKCSSTRFPSHSNRRYLIVTYVVEFDRINYPIPLEYCGLPDPLILQATIKRLENELEMAHEELLSRDSSEDKQKIRTLQKRVDDLKAENSNLHGEIRRLTKIIAQKPAGPIHKFENAITQIERNLISERRSHHKLLEKVQKEKLCLVHQLEKLKRSEKSLKTKLELALSGVNINGDHNHKNLKYLHSKSPEGSVDFIFRKDTAHRKESPCRRKGYKHRFQSVYQRSRSASPRSPYNEFQDEIRSKSRSSSLSSVKSRSNASPRSNMSPVPSHTIFNKSPKSDRSSKSYNSAGEVKGARSRSASPYLMNRFDMKLNRIFQVCKKK